MLVTTDLPLPLVCDFSIFVLITRITPDRVNSEGGALVMIKGGNFAPNTFVVVGGILISRMEVEDTETLAFVAPTLPSGRITVSVQNRGGFGSNIIVGGCGSI